MTEAPPAPRQLPTRQARIPLGEDIYKKTEISRHRHFARIPALPARISYLPSALAHPQLSLPGLGPRKGTLFSLPASHSDRRRGLIRERQRGSRGFLQARSPVLPSLPNNIPPSAPWPRARRLGRGPQACLRPRLRRKGRERRAKMGPALESSIPCRKRHWSPALPPPAPPSSRPPCSLREPAPERWAAGARGPAAAAAALLHAPRQRRRSHRRRLRSPSANHPL